ncbi:hypothetical protein VE02_02682 [Pseudogymnoascus sp. 03VT05]|nr:hypothetical protein VE02_02682 [Pseudogymnoascus sp. 03VT05]
MANPPNPPNPPVLQATAGALHNDNTLSQYLLNNLETSVTLEFLPSKIHANGTGLFAKEAIPEGSEIFRSTPFVTCVRNGHHGSICDYCHTSNEGDVDAEGNFLTEGVVVPTISRCERCDVCGYCSEICQIKAWIEYHKFECQALKLSPRPASEIRMLYRVLAMHKQNNILGLEFRALHNLWSDQGQDPLATANYMMTIAMNAETLIQSGLGNEIIRDIFWKIHTNIRCIESHHEEAFGYALDFVLSFINHSCDPNAHMFIERGKLRMRSLKPIKAGDEITQTYTDLRPGVMMRRERLESEYSFTCQCNRCKNGYRKLHALALSEGLSVKDVVETEKKFHDIRKQAVSYNTTDQVENIVASLTKTIFPARPWNDTIYPIGAIKFHFAKLYSSSGNCHQAAIYAIQGCLTTTPRSGLEWPDDLHMLLQYFKKSMLAPRAAVTEMPDPQNLQTFFNGILHEVVVLSRKGYGVDSKYTIALDNWRIDMLKSAEPPLPGEEGFAEKFAEAQVSVLKWAGVDEKRGIVLSDVVLDDGVMVGDRVIVGDGVSQMELDLGVKTERTGCCCMH